MTRKELKRRLLLWDDEDENQEVRLCVFQYVDDKVKVIEYDIQDMFDSLDRTNNTKPLFIIAGEVLKEEFEEN